MPKTLPSAPRIIAAIIRNRPDRSTATCIFSGREKPISLGYFLTPLTISCANQPALTVDRWRTLFWQTETTFSEIANQSPFFSSGWAYFCKRYKRSSPKLILWVLIGNRAYFTPLNSNIFIEWRDAPKLVPRARVELARPCGPGILSPVRIPFRHLGYFSTFILPTFGKLVGTDPAHPQPHAARPVGR